jgi:hypothetical protein
VLLENINSKIPPTTLKKKKNYKVAFEPSKKRN